MTTIKKITDKQGNDIYLRTHTKAVVDDNGYTVESRLQATEDIVNQAQLEIGAVPSDLTPTDGSTNWVTSGGVYNSVHIGDNTEIDLSAFNDVAGWITSTTKKWNINNYGRFIPVTSGKTYRIIANETSSVYAFLKSNVVGSNNSSVTTFATGSTSTLVYEGATVEETAPSDAKYLWVSSIGDNNRNALPQNVVEINATSVRTFLSNIDTTPIENSQNLVSSGGVYNAIEGATEDYVNIDLSSLTEQNCSIGSTMWYMNTSTNAQRHKAIPVVEGEIYTISIQSIQNDGNCQIAWLSSSYAPPYSNNNLLPLATGQTGRIVTKGQLVVPEGASFLAFTTVDGGGVVYDIVLKKRTNKYDTLSEKIDSLESFEDEYIAKNDIHEIPSDSIDFFIHTTYKWYSSTTYTSKLYNVREYRGHTISVTKKGNYSCRFAFLTNNTAVNNQTPSYCDGYSAYIQIDTSDEKTYMIPQDCNYLYVYTNSNGTDVTPFIYIDVPFIETISDDYFSKKSDIDLSGLTEQDCSLGASSIGWYMNTSTQAQRHIALSVQQGEVYRITATTGGWWGYLTSAYSPPYSNSDAIPYVEGTDRMPRPTNYMVKIPKGCAYLALTTVDGAGNAITWTIEKGEAIRNLSLPVPIKLRIAHWNVGHFTYYDGAQGNSTPNIPTTLVDIPYTTKFNQGKFNDDGTTTSSNYYVYSRYIRYSGNISLSEGFAIENLIRCNISENTFTSESVDSQSLAFTVNDGEYIRLNIKKSNGGTILPTDSIISSLTIKKPKNEWMKERYRTVINNIDADILCVCEDDPVFDAAGTTSLSAIYSCYNTKIQGTKYNYMCASVYSNLPAMNVDETMYAQTIQANRYFKTTLFELNGKNVYIVETHFDWNQNSNGPAYRASQIQQVINAFADKDYVVISGDFNINTILESEEMQPFIDAGYTLANGGYMGFLRTSRELAHIDHICAKGFSISNIKLYEESLDLSDHCLISCELTML